MFKKTDSKLAGCFELQPRKLVDERGIFIKTFHEPFFRSLGLTTNFIEEYYTISKKDVIRGMHFQLPPHDHDKLVYCIAGGVLDVVLDLRLDSPTYNQYVSFELNADKASMVYIPKGMAHGFRALTDNATMMYKVSSVYHSQSEAGIRWDSFGYDWGLDKPIMSARDKCFDGLVKFLSPF